MIRIPSDRRWTQSNASDVFGTLSSTYNVQFDQEGYATLSPKSVSIYSGSDDSDFRLAQSIFYFDSGYFILTPGECFQIDSRLAVSKIAGAPNDLTTNSDALVWQSRAYVTTQDDLVYWSGSAWTTGLKTLAAKPHPMAVMGNFANGHLVIGNGNTVLRLDTSHNTVVTLTLNDDYQVETLKYFNNNLYIGTKATSGGDAKMFVWNGSGTSAQSEFTAGANWIFSIGEYKSSVIAITSEGQLIRFTGGGFEALASLPVYHTNYRWTNGAPRVHRRGLAVDGDVVYINIQGAVSYKTDDYYYLHNQPSGIWCYDQKVGLYARHLSTTDALLTINVSSLSSDTLTLASATNAVTGEPILVRENGSLTGVSDNTLYYIIRVSSTEVKLATTRANAIAGNAITLGGAATSATVQIVGYEEYGAMYDSGDAGCIGVIGFDGTSPRVFPDIIYHLIMWGYSPDGGIEYLNALSPASNVGGFTTSKIWSSQVTDVFQKLFVKTRGVYTDTDTMYVRSLEKDTFGLPSEAIEGTWSSTRVLGTADEAINQASVGDTVTIISGGGAGLSAQIVSITGDELELDRTFDMVASAEAVTFVITGFKQNGVVTENPQSIPLSGPASRVQLSVELKGQGVAVEELQLVNNVHRASA